MPFSISPLRHDESPSGGDPTGEGLLDRRVRPYRVWVPQDKVLVLGNSQDAERELNAEAVLGDRVPVYRRMSGGGAVLLSPGCLCLGLRFAKRKELAIQDYFAKGSGLIRTVAGNKLGLDLRHRGISDLVCSKADGKFPLGGDGVAGNPDPERDRKVAGCALYMPRDFVLYLVSILIDPDFSEMEKYLAHPSKEPDYRASRSHRDFLAGLASLTERPILAGEMIPWFEEAIESVLQSDLDWELFRPDPPDPLYSRPA
jgi:lipoate---protein ligase